MKLVFFILLLANVVLLLVLQSARTPGIEPERIAAQLHPDRLTVIAQPPVAPQAAAPAPEDKAAAATPLACIDLGDFTARAAEEVEPPLAQVSPGVQPAIRLVQAPPQHIVYVPPQAGEAAAGRRLAQLREKGFADSAIIRDEPSRRWGISLGLFSRHDLAESHQQKLRAAGIADARVAEYPVNSARYAFRLDGLDGAAAGRLKALASGIAGVALRSCE